MQMSAAQELSQEAALVVAGVSLPVPTIIDADKNNLLGKLAEEIASFTPDISTPAGRQRVASLAYKVSKTKADLIRLGKVMTEEWRRSVKAVNEECAVIEERMDALRDRVRAPLTEFEDREKARVKGHEGALAAMSALAVFNGFVPDSDLLRSALERLDAAEAGRDWQEFAQRASDLHAELGFKLTALLEVTLEREREAAAFEKRRLEAEEAARQAAERDQREREARIAAKAAEVARIAAERRAAEAAAAERQRVEQERLRAEEARLAAESRAAEAEQRRLEVERRAEAARAAAAEKAEQDRIAAVEAERRRAAAESRAAEAAAADRERNVEIRRGIHFDAAADLVATVYLTEAQAIGVVKAIAKGRIRNVRISY
jgi:hypothetical protein